MDNGKLGLSSGSTKASGDIWFYCTFDRMRVYSPNYGFNFHSLVQRPASFFIVNRALIVSTLQNGIEQNTNDLRVLGVDVGYDPSDSRRDLTLRIEYAAVEESKTEVQGVTFV